MMNPLQRARFWTLGWLFIALCALLAIGAIRSRHAFLTRGLPDALPEPVRGGGAAVGLNVSLEQYDEAGLEQALSQMQALGVQTLKQSFYYRPDFDWSASDRLVTAVNRHGLTLIPLLDGNPADHFAFVEPNTFAEWAATFAKRYPAPAFIIWDEPNLTAHWGDQPVNPNDYAALLTAAAAAIRQAAPQALIVAAPLAPTSESGPQNLADPLYLQALYDAGAASAFDVVAGKPYGFDTPPDDRRVALETLNFSRLLLLREVMAQNGDTDKAVWAGNWGWNSLPAGWSGPPSIWGQVTASQQAAWTSAAFNRARQEWPWAGQMFLENWQPAAPADDPRWGFSIAGRETAVALQALWQEPATLAYTGFHLAQPNDPSQSYVGGWAFSPQFGADISQTPEGAPGDQATFTFWGTEVGLRVRRADFRARLYVQIDGRPANALPRDENGTMLILTSPDPSDDTITTELVARNLAPGPHTLTLQASRGWDQWALNGFSVASRPTNGRYQASQIALVFLAVVALGLGVQAARRAAWPAWLAEHGLAYRRLSDPLQGAMVAVIAAIVALSGWLTWGEQAAGLYRRFGDGSQLAVTVATAVVFIVTPSFFVYIAALTVLFCLLTFRPAWGLALIALVIPFYVLPKPILGYRFSAVEIFTLTTFAATMLAKVLRWQRPFTLSWHWADTAVLTFVTVATLSLFFTARLDVALNEWRVVIVEPALFYALIRTIRPTPQELWAMVDAFVLGGFIVAAYGLWQYAFHPEQLITSEGGLLRLRAFYGSPNNVALYLGRVLPLAVAVVLFGIADASQPSHVWRRWLYAIFVLPMGLAFLLTFSKGGLFLGLPAAGLFLFWQWQKHHGRTTWPWVIGFALCGGLGLLGISRVPQLAGRLDVAGATGVFRVNLWQASWQMFREHPWWGVGLDNFLYAYRGRYIFDAAWQEPNLNHPHNILLDFATRLGTLGLLAGGWLVGTLGVGVARLLHACRLGQGNGRWLGLTVGIGGALVDMLVHGLVDHSFFLVDLAFAFYLCLGLVHLLADFTAQKA